MNLERLYLDYNATSPLSESVLNWLKSGDLLFANPASQHSDGKASRKAINEARSFLYKTFHKTEKDTRLFFHSGATEGIHTFAHSFAEMARLQNKKLLLCYSAIDHQAVTSLKDKFFGPHVETFELKRDKNLLYSFDENFLALKELKKNNPDLVILYHHLWVHNETGQVSDLDHLKKFKEIPDLFIHVDAVQAPGKISNWSDLSIGDIWSFSAHKFGALKGIGFSFFSSEISFHPLITGGGQQSSFRSGTENVIGVKSVHLALKDLLEVDVEKTQKIRGELVTFMKEKLQGRGEILGYGPQASNTIYFYFNELSSDVALALFDIHGLEISAGSACSSGAARPSAVLLQAGLINQAKNGLRISLGFNPRLDQIAFLKERFTQAVSKV